MWLSGLGFDSRPHFLCLPPASCLVPVFAQAGGGETVLLEEAAYTQMGRVVEVCGVLLCVSWRAAGSPNHQGGKGGGGAGGEDAHLPTPTSRPRVPLVQMDRAHTRGTRENDVLETGLWGACGREISVDASST